MNNQTESELTVEAALQELKEMFPDNESSIEFDTNNRVLITVFDSRMPHFDYYTALADSMAQVRAWRDSQQQEG